MEKYLILYLKSGDRRYPIAQYYENSRIFSYFKSHVNKHEDTELNDELLNEMISYVYCDIDDVLKQIGNLKLRIEEIKNLNNPAGEKVDLILELKRKISKIEETERDYENACSFMRYLKEIIYLNDYTPRSLNGLEIREKGYVYGRILEVEKRRAV